MLLILFGQNTNLTFCLTYRAGQLGWPGPHANPVMDGALLVSLALFIWLIIRFIRLVFFSRNSIFLS
jgi:hypothetical protein